MVLMQMHANAVSHGRNRYLRDCELWQRKVERTAHDSNWLRSNATWTQQIKEPDELYKFGSSETAKITLDYFKGKETQMFLTTPWFFWTSSSAAKIFKPSNSCSMAWLPTNLTLLSQKPWVSWVDLKWQMHHFRGSSGDMITIFCQRECMTS